MSLGDIVRLSNAIGELADLVRELTAKLEAGTQAVAALEARVAALEEAATKPKAKAA